MIDFVQKKRAIKTILNVPKNIKNAKKRGPILVYFQKNNTKADQLLRLFKINITLRLFPLKLGQNLHSFSQVVISKYTD